MFCLFSGVLILKFSLFLLVFIKRHGVGIGNTLFNNGGEHLSLFFIILWFMERSNCLVWNIRENKGWNIRGIGDIKINFLFTKNRTSNKLLRYLSI